MAEAGAVRATVLLCATPPRGVLATSPTLIGRQLKRWCHRRGFNATATSACSRGRLLPGRLAGEVECLQLAVQRPSSLNVSGLIVDGRSSLSRRTLRPEADSRLMRQRERRSAARGHALPVESRRERSETGPRDAARQASLPVDTVVSARATLPRWAARVIGYSMLRGGRYEADSSCPVL